MRKTLLFLGALMALSSLQAQWITLQDAQGQLPADFVRNHLMGSDGVYIFNVKFNGSPGPIGMPQIASFDANGFTGLEIDSGIVMTTGKIEQILPGGSSNVTISPYYADPVQEEAGLNPFACATLDFDFVCLTNTFSFRYCYASFEYSCCVGSVWFDEFDFYLSGPDAVTGEYVTRNIARVPGSECSLFPDGWPVSINSINNGLMGPIAWFPGTWTSDYTDLYVDNYPPTAGCKFPGWTTKLTATSQVIPCEVYHMHMTVCNVNDNDINSGVFLEGGSFQSPSAQIGLTRTTIDTVPGSCGLGVPLSLAQTDAFDAGTVHFAYGGEAVYGVDYELVDERGWVLDSTGLAIDNTEHSFVVRALPGADLSEPKSVELYLLTSLCPLYPELVTHDTMRFVLARGGDVQVGDTTITCSQACFEVSAPLVYGDDATTSYRWEPTTGIDDPYSRTSTAAIFESRDYKLIATGGSGCNSDTATVHVVVTNTVPEGPVNIEETEAGAVRVWPNPAGDVIHVEAEGLQRVELYSLDGKLVGSGQTDLPTEGLANGTYGLRIVTATGSTASKIVINK